MLLLLKYDAIRILSEPVWFSRRRYDDDDGVPRMKPLVCWTDNKFPGVGGTHLSPPSPFILFTRKYVRNIRLLAVQSGSSGGYRRHNTALDAITQTTQFSNQKRTCLERRVRRKSRRWCSPVFTRFVTCFRSEKSPFSFYLRQHHFIIS